MMLDFFRASEITKTAVCCCIGLEGVCAGFLKNGML